MVDRIRKTLRKQSKKHQEQLKEVIRRITADDLIGLDIKKLQGSNDVYRVRRASFRIIFRRNSNAMNVILSVEKRSDNTYNDF